MDRQSVPLFVLTAPDVPTCEATMVRASSLSVGWALELEFIGGIEVGKKVTVSWANEVSVGAGRASEVFYPLWVDVQEVTMHFDDDREERLVHEVNLRPRDLLKALVGVRTLQDWSPPRGRRVQLLEADLGEQSPEDPAVSVEFEYETEASGEASIGFGAFGAKHEISFSASKTRSHKLAADLAPGHVYRGSVGAWPPHLVWTVDQQPD